MIATVARVSYKRGLWLVVCVNKNAKTVSENSLRLFGNFDKKLTNRLSVFMEKGHIFPKV